MKPYFKVKDKKKRHAVIAITEEYRLVVNVRKVGRGYSEEFDVEELDLTRRPDVRGIWYACKLALNFASKVSGKNLHRGGGGGRVPYEYNDEKHWWYFAKHGKKMSFDGHTYHIPGGKKMNAAELRRYRKVAGEAVRFRIGRALRFAFNKYLGGW